VSFIVFWIVFYFWSNFVFCCSTQVGWKVESAIRNIDQNSLNFLASGYA